MPDILIRGMISIHVPRVGHDANMRESAVPRYDFNPRAPCGARRRGFCHAALEVHISLHVPREGRDELNWHTVGVCVEGFQSTRPEWGVTRENHFLCGKRPISIHVPRVGHDIKFDAFSLRGMAFQSTRPMWGTTRRCASAARS